jgi:tetratricopeptide (TPR) repeat protein/O-antigen ligase
MTRSIDRTLPIARIFLSLWWFMLIWLNLLATIEPLSGLIMLTLTALGVGGWLLWRTIRRWRWYALPLDRLIPLWIGAFVLSWAVNPDASRQIGFGVWFGGLYCAAWVMFQDLITNRALSRNAVIESLLVGGGLSMVLSLPEAFGAVREWLTLGALPRINGQMGSAVVQSGVLVVVLPMAASALLTARGRLARIGWGVYITTGVILILLTQSRTGWIALAAGAVIWGGLAGVGAYWRHLPRMAQMAAIVVGIGFLALGGWILVSRTLSVANQSGVDARPALYQTALTMFAERPLTGYGLFSFGLHYMRLGSFPPDETLAHAHQLVLNMASELGLIGLGLGALSLWVWARAMRRNMGASSGSQRTLLIGAVAACLTYLVHHQFDMVTIYLVAAFFGLLALVVATAPVVPVPVPRWSQAPRTVLIALLWGGLLVAGFWERRITADYTALITGPLAEKSGVPYVEQAALFDPLIAADPTLPGYPLLQGGLYGLAAQGGDLEAARRGVAAYERFTELHAYYSPAWANLAVLRWQLGQRDAAITAMQRAAELSPRHWAMWANLGALQEANGELTAAAASYTRALRDYPLGDMTLYPFWDETPLRQQAAAPRRAEGYTNWGRAVLALRAGDTANARQEYDSVPHIDNPIYDAIEMALYYAEGRTSDLRAVGAGLASRTPMAYTVDAQTFGRALTALADGDRAGAAAELAALRRSMAQRPIFLQTSYGANGLLGMHYLRFLSKHDQWLPAVFSPHHSPLLHPLADWLEAQLR